MNPMMIDTPEVLGRIVRETRKASGLTQPELALAAGTGVPFIVDLERGKATIQLGKALGVLPALRIELHVSGVHVMSDD
jgi:HTH-type transcriptional regulator / antitoxin HipB